MVILNQPFNLTKIERHQMLMHIHYAKSSLLDFKKSQGICTKEVTLEVLEPFVREAIEDAFNFEKGEILFESKAIIIEGNQYGTGKCAVLSCEDGETLFGYISSIFLYKRKDYLLCDLLVVNEFNTHFNCYLTEKSGYYEIVDLNKIYDYHPLGVYYIASKMLVPLHHHLKFS